MAKYIKKPIEIEAIMLERNICSIQEVYTFMKWFTHTKFKMGKEKWDEHLEEVMKSQGIIIPTLEGDMIAQWGDYIIKGVKGEFYPCKPDIFEMTYEKCSD